MPSAVLRRVAPRGWFILCVILLTKVHLGTPNRPPQDAELAYPPGGAGPSGLPNPSRLNADGRTYERGTLLGHPYQFGLMSGATSVESAMPIKRIPDQNEQLKYSSSANDLIPTSASLKPDRREITSDMMAHDRPREVSGVAPTHVPGQLSIAQLPPAAS